MTFRVEITPEAERDAADILAWLLGQHAGETGIRWFQALYDAIDTLSTFPERFPRAPENARFSFEVRYLQYGRKPHLYRILFTIDGGTVYILHIRHGRRLPVT